MWPYINRYDSLLVKFNRRKKNTLVELGEIISAQEPCWYDIQGHPLIQSSLAGQGGLEVIKWSWVPSSEISEK